MKKTALYNKHIELGAKMVPFADYLMPVQYSGVNSEHINVRKGVGVFDVSHMGQFYISGKNIEEALEKMQSVVAGHMERFAFRDEISLVWERQ